MIGVSQMGQHKETFPPSVVLKLKFQSDPHTNRFLKSFCRACMRFPPAKFMTHVGQNDTLIHADYPP